MVLVIAGVVIMIVFPALNLMRQTAQQSATEANLTSLMRATTAYVQAHGCLPCPTPAATLGSGFGRVRGDTGTNACGTCTVAEGIVPFASLGISRQIAKDGWGRWITMRVDPALTSSNLGSVIPPTSLCTSSDSLPCITGQSRKGFCQPDLPTTGRINILTPGGARQQAAVIFVSHGANGYGAYYADPVANTGLNQHPAFKGSSTACSDDGGYERCNANGDTSFVQASLTPDAVDPYDDLLAFADRNTLVTLLGNPACQAAW